MTNSSIVKQVEVPSESDPRRTYTVSVYEEGHAHCTCPAWMKSRLATEQRICKHIESVTGELRRGDGYLSDAETAWLVRELVKLTDKPFSEVAEAVEDYIFENEDLDEYTITLGNDIVGTLQTLWPKAAPGPDSQRALNLVKRALDKAS